jgi:hypothetical protein
MPTHTLEPACSILLGQHETLWIAHRKTVAELSKEKMSVGTKQLDQKGKP